MIASRTATPWRALKRVYTPLYKSRQVVHVVLCHIAGKVRNARQPREGRTAGELREGADNGAAAAVRVVHVSSRSAYRRNRETGTTKAARLQGGRSSLRLQHNQGEASTSILYAASMR